MHSGVGLLVNPLEGVLKDKKRCSELEHPQWTSLIYRVEDMLPQTSGYARLLAHSSTFLETILVSLPHVNRSTARRSRALSERSGGDSGWLTKCLTRFIASL